MPSDTPADRLYQPLSLPCGVVLKNRLAKAAMSDSLGDGEGNPTDEQMRLYQRWAGGGAGLAIIGEVAVNPAFAEKPGNLVLGPKAFGKRFEQLAHKGAENGSQLWLQLGNAGALTHPPIGTPKGPSAISMPELTCAALKIEEIRAIPGEFARAAEMAKQLGFGGVEIHAAHGFLLSQFLSPLFNRRDDEYGGDINARMRLLLEVIAATRAAVGPRYPVGVKLNATDQMVGGLEEEESLDVVAALDKHNIDLLDISGGAYFPGSTAASDRVSGKPYFADFAKRARQLTHTPLMLTGGIRTRNQAIEVLESGTADLLGLARGFALHPDLPMRWQAGDALELAFPRFENPPPGGVTAWFTMRLTDLGCDREDSSTPDLQAAVEAYNTRDAERETGWNRCFRSAD